MNKAKTIAVTLITAIAVAIAVSMCHMLMESRKAHVDVPRMTFPIRGIDISAHNGNVDFDLVRSDSIDFAMIKVSEGISFRDSLFGTNYFKARQSGLKVGAYHFFRFDCEGWRQADNMLEAIGQKHLDLPVAIDVEEWGNPDNYSTSQVVTQLRGMIDFLRENGREAIIYTNKNGYYRFIRSRFEDMPIWICSFTDPPVESGRWTLWQHSHISHVRGIEGNVDMNTFNGSRAEWEDWLSACQ